MEKKDKIEDCLISQCPVPIKEIHDRQNEQEHKVLTINYFPEDASCIFLAQKNTNKKIKDLISVMFFDSLQPNKR